jgi:phosphoglycolate phosphatase
MSAAAVFDLDGTLIDSRPAIVASIRHVERCYGLPAVEELGWALGPPLRDIMRRLLMSREHQPIEEAVALYRQHHESVCLTEARPFAGIAEALATLERSGCPLFVCTSKLDSLARRVLTHFDLFGRFRALYASDAAGILATKADLLQRLLAVERIAPSRAVMVGDRGSDISAAKALGLRTCGVSYGYGAPGELEAVDPDWICGSAPELPAVLLAAIGGDGSGSAPNRTGHSSSAGGREIA